MIDPADKQTKSLPLEQPKRGRGRPKKDAALTPAQKQKAYRERLKSNVTINNKDDGQIEFLRKLVDKERENLDRLAEKVIRLEREKKELLKRAELAEAERDAMGNELAKMKAKRQKPAQTKRRYVLQYKMHDEKWIDDATGDYGNKAHADSACKRMNEPGVSQGEWRVRERQWV
jgi:hypothetical protein